MKRDVVAAITFLMTGLLFYLAQSSEKSKDSLSFDDGCSASEAVMVDGSFPEGPSDLFFQNPGTLDS